MIEQAADPRAALLAAWNSGKIVHREVAIGALRRVLPGDQPLPPEFDSLLLSAALDPDMNVRESPWVSCASATILHWRRDRRAATGLRLKVRADRIMKRVSRRGIDGDSVAGRFRSTHRHPGLSAGKLERRVWRQTQRDRVIRE